MDNVNDPINNQKNGLSKSSVISFPLVKNAMEGVEAEYEWIRINLPNCKVLAQRFSHQGDRQFDIITVLLADGCRQDIHFDITNFFGIFE